MFATLCLQLCAIWFNSTNKLLAFWLYDPRVVNRENFAWYFKLIVNSYLPLPNMENYKNLLGAFSSYDVYVGLFIVFIFEKLKKAEITN